MPNDGPYGVTLPTRESGVDACTCEPAIGRPSSAYHVPARLDEDETVEIIRVGGDVRVLYVGLDMAMARTRSAYLQGEIEVDAFEQEIDRLLRKRAGLTAS